MKFLWAFIEGMLDAVYPPSRKERDERLANKLARLKQEAEARLNLGVR